MPEVQTPLSNYIDSTWQKSATDELLDVTNPATGEILAQVPLSPAEEVHQAATAACRSTPRMATYPARPTRSIPLCLEKSIGRKH